MIPDLDIRSSWVISPNGFATRVDQVEPRVNGARCSACNEPGHNVRTCPIAETEMDLRR